MVWWFCCSSSSPSSVQASQQLSLPPRMTLMCCPGDSKWLSEPLLGGGSRCVGHQDLLEPSRRGDNGAGGCGGDATELRLSRQQSRVVDGLFRGVQGQVMGPGGTGAGRTELEASISLVILPKGEGHLGLFSSSPAPTAHRHLSFCWSRRNVTVTADCFRCFNIRLYWHAAASLCTSITLSIRVTGTKESARLPPLQLWGFERPGDYLFSSLWHAGSKLSATQNELPFSCGAQHHPLVHLWCS